MLPICRLRDELPTCDQRSFSGSLNKLTRILSVNLYFAFSLQNVAWIHFLLLHSAVFWLSTAQQLPQTSSHAKISVFSEMRNAIHGIVPLDQPSFQHMSESVGPEGAV